MIVFSFVRGLSHFKEKIYISGPGHVTTVAWYHGTYTCTTSHCTVLQRVQTLLTAQKVPYFGSTPWDVTKQRASRASRGTCSQSSVASWPVAIWFYTKGLPWLSHKEIAPRVRIHVSPSPQSPHKFMNENDQIATGRFQNTLLITTYKAATERCVTVSSFGIYGQRLSTQVESSSSTQRNGCCMYERAYRKKKHRETWPICLGTTALQKSAMLQKRFASS